MNCQIDIAVNAPGWPDEAKLEAIAQAAVGAALATAEPSLADGSEVSLAFVDDAEMTRLNGQWRGKAQPTNVLSFPGSPDPGGEPAGPLLGDIVLALETVTREAALEGKRFEHHVTHLIIHGFLHLLGYDHIEDREAAEMEALESSALARLDIADPYA